MYREKDDRDDLRCEMGSAGKELAQIKLQHGKGTLVGGKMTESEGKKKVLTGVQKGV